MSHREAELKTLMLAALNGDASAYRVLLHRLSRHLHGYYKRHLVRAGRGAEEAEDLVQEALLAIHLNRHAFDVGALFTPWVHAIARYKLIDYLRRSRLSLSEIPIDDHGELVAADNQASVESAYDMRRLLGSLPEKTRCAIETVKLEGESVAEAAVRCGLSESGVKISIHRGLKALVSLSPERARRNRAGVTSA